MRLASIVSMQRAHQVGFVDEHHLCYAAPCGLIIEHVTTGRQNHIWCDKQLHVPHGQSVFAIDQMNGQIALHQDGARKAISIICAHTLDVIDTLPTCHESTAQGVKQALLHHMSFSSDGHRLVVGTWLHVFTLFVFSRPSPRDAFSVICSQTTDVSSHAQPPTFFPGHSDNLCCIDQGVINILRLEPVLGRMDVKNCQVDMTLLPANATLTAHTWQLDGSLLVGSSMGKLYIVRKAAVELARSHDMDAAGSTMFQLQSILDDELSRWTAGAIIGLHVSGSKLSIVFECPDGKGGVLLRADTSALYVDDHQISSCANDELTMRQSLKAVQLPVSKVVFSALSPDKSQMALVDGQAKILVLHTDADPETGSFSLASTSHCGYVIGIEPVQGTPAAAGMLFVTLDVTGVLRALVLEPQSRTNGGDITAKLTMLKAGWIGTDCSALAAHPVQPLLAVATQNGQLHLIGVTEFTGYKEQHEAAGHPCVQFSARTLDQGCNKALAWSPDGAVLACLETRSQRVVLLRRKSSPFQEKDKHILVPQSRISVPYATLMCWHQPGNGIPVLIIHQAQGYLLIINLPRETAGAQSPPIALQTVLRASYRLPAPLSDMRVLQSHSSDSQVCIIGAFMDCSVRKFHVTLEQARAKKSISNVIPVVSIDAEVQQVLQGKPTCVALAPSCSTLFVGCRSGTLHRFDVSTLQISGVTVQHHGNTSDGISAVAVLGEDSLVTADTDGIMHAMVISSQLKNSLGIHGSPGFLHTQNSYSLRPQGGLFDISDTAMASCVDMRMVSTEVLPLDEVLKMILIKQFERKRDKLKENISSGVQNCAKRLMHLKRHNDAVIDASERLSAGELIICKQFASKLRDAGMKQIAAMKMSLKRETVMETLKATKILESTRHTMVVQEEAMASIPAYQLLSPVDINLDKYKRSYCQYDLLYKMAQPKMYEKQQLSLYQCAFLRGVEQYEWSTRPLQDQGMFAAVKLVTVADLEVATTVASTQNSISAAKSLSTISRGTQQALAYADVHNGNCRLLYAPLQLHLHRRKISQLQLLALEEQAIYSNFNEKFCTVRKSKDHLLGKIEEQLARVSSIQAELGVSQQPSDLIVAPEEDETRWIRVEAHELEATQGLPPAERQRREEAARQKAEQEAAANGNKSQSTALDAMMNGSPEKRSKNDMEQLQRRESWMDMPAKAMSKAQRVALKEYEHQVQEAEENLRNAHRILEGERKAVEEEIVEAIYTFNTDFDALQQERLWSEVQLAITQELRLSSCSTLLEVSQLATSKLEEQRDLAWRKQRLTCLRSINDGLMNQVAEQHAEYLELAHSCQLMDRFFSKTFQGLSAQFQIALDVYRNTEHCPAYIKYGDKHGIRVAPEVDDVLEGTVPMHQGKPRRGKCGASTAGTSGELSGKSCWRPGRSPPLQPTWNDGPALSAEDRPEAISESDWTRIIQYRDCRLGLLAKLARAWETGTSLVSVMDAYTAETASLSKKLQAAHEKMEKTKQDALNYKIDVPIVFVGCGGQVEVTEDQLLPDMQTAVLMKKDRVQVLNYAVHRQAAKVQERLQDCSELRSRQQGVAWGLSLSDLAAAHKAEHVKELQLFHVTKGVQDLLDCNRSEAFKKTSEMKALERLRELNRRVQASQIKERSIKFVNLTDAVAKRLEMNEELSNATEEAFRIIKKHEHIKHLDESNIEDRAVRTETHFKRIAIQNKLQKVALTQTRELLHLFAEKEALIERNFPTFRHDT